MGKVDNLYSPRYYSSWIEDQEDILDKFQPFLSAPQVYFGYGKKTHNWGCKILTTIGNEHENELPWDILKPYILEGGHELIKTYIPRRPYTLDVSMIWVNIYSRGDYQEIHDHINLDAHFSFSYILESDQMTSSSHFQFYNDTSFMRHVFPVDYFADPITNTLHRPKQIQGTLLVFPSSMKHMVTQHLSDSRRSTISGNITVNF